jgi:hypothetical protein
MPCIRYVNRRFNAGSQSVIAQANAIITEYAAQGFDLTLRQLYYQFVARDLLGNTTENYKRLGSIVNDARLAGLIDWDRLVDRTRGVEQLAVWDGPEDIVDTCSRQFRHDLWAGQSHRPEVWIEKEALAGVFEGVCNELRVPYLSCRGYTSQSEMWRAGQRFRAIKKSGQTPVILHFGDHDPSGIDMSRDIAERLKMFVGGDGVEVRRLALNMAQVEEHNPPPNPAKATDARFNSYQAEHGNESWELDALEPALLAQLVQDAVAGMRDDVAWQEAVEREEEARRLLGEVSSRWDDITSGL